MLEKLFNFIGRCISWVFLLAGPFTIVVIVIYLVAFRAGYSVPLLPWENPFAYKGYAVIGNVVILTVIAIPLIIISLILLKHKVRKK
jgi:hypothetical protein